MIRKISFLLLFVILTGCSGEARATLQPTAPPAANPLPTAIAAMVTATPFPLASLTPALTATATPTVTHTPPAQPAVLAQQPGFQDCARTPGLGSCDPQAASLTGLVTFVDAQTSRIVTVDLATGAGWQAPLPEGGKAHISRMDWSPKGDRLAEFYDTGGYEIRSRDGSSLQSGTVGDALPEWQPDGALSLDGSVTSADGRSARLEQNPQTGWHLILIEKPGTAPKDLAISQPTDEIYTLRGWVPGTDLLLGQAFYASNSAMLLGGQIITIDTTNGGVQQHDAIAPLLPEGDFTWNPAKPGQLAFLQSGMKIMTARTIGLLDFSTGQLRNPLAETVMVANLAWSPDGQWLAFSASPWEDAPAETRAIFPGPGIYLLDPLSGKVSPVLQSPQGAVDGWLHWSADGKAILYARTVGEQTAVRLHPLEGSPDRVLINGLPAPQSAAEPLWYSILAYTQPRP